MSKYPNMKYYQDNMGFIYYVNDAFIRKNLSVTNSHLCTMYNEFNIQGTQVCENVKFLWGCREITEEDCNKQRMIWELSK